jgi:hypothetical protein
MLQVNKEVFNKTSINVTYVTVTIFIVVEF